MTHSSARPGHIDQTDEIPRDLFRHSQALTVTVVENRRLTPADCSADVRHLVLRYPPEQFQFLEGQAIGIAPGGLNSRGRPNAPRLYSVASDRLGDDGTGQTLTLTVKRVRYKGQDGKEKQGITSQHLCDAQPGDALSLTGPVGVSLVLLPQPRAPLVLLATGTGIAPFRAYLRHMLRIPAEQRVPIWLIFGARTADEALYAGEWLDMQKELDLRVDYALSRSQVNAQGGRMYVPDLMWTFRDELWDWLHARGATLVVCGVRGLELGALDVLERLAQERGTSGTEWIQGLREQHRLRIEVY